MNARERDELMIRMDERVKTVFNKMDDFDTMFNNHLHHHEVWEDDMNEGGGGLSPSVGDVIGDGSSICAEVTALNATGSVDSYTYDSFSDCDECNSYYLVCEDMGGP